jgi:hypothetical protein
MSLRRSPPTTHSQENLRALMHDACFELSLFDRGGSKYQEKHRRFVVCYWITASRSFVALSDLIERLLQPECQKQCTER